ncbi:Auxilin-like protein 1 [Linum perenne]
MEEESWRRRRRTSHPHPPTILHRRSTENNSADAAPPSASSLFNRRSVDNNLDPNNFADVFGGPPRTVLERKFSGDFTTRASSSSSFYEVVFRPPGGIVSPEKKKGGGRNLPAFRIPAKGEGFYSDVFGSDDVEDYGLKSRERSRTNSKGKSKSNSSNSVMSSEDLIMSPALSSLTSNLSRPINVPSRWNSNTMKPAEKKQDEAPSFPYNHCTPPPPPPYYDHDHGYNMENNNYNVKWSSPSDNYSFKVSRQFSSPETTTVEPNSNWSTKCSGDDDDDDDDLEVNSASSSVLICQQDEEEEEEEEDASEVKPAGFDHSYNHMMQDHHDYLDEEDDDNNFDHDDDDDDDVMSSYVIEINSESNHRDGINGEAVSIDDAIAWAKEKFQAYNNDKLLQSAKSQDEVCEQGNKVDTRIQSSMVEGDTAKCVTGDTEEDAGRDMEIELLNEDIRLWSSGKQSNIRLLLSSLHHIIEPAESGWNAIPLTSLVEKSQVKKGYQKARLCLHPDKLQQRGATPHHKYVAHKAFAILQDAWASFISQDVLLN